MSKNNRFRQNTRFHRRTKPGAAPGTLAADPSAPKPNIHLMAYSELDVLERDIVDPKDMRAILDDPSWRVTWINVDGLGDAGVVAAIGEVFGLHKLALEDVLNTHQRAKVEQYGEHLFIVARMVEDNSHGIGTDQLSMFLNQRFVVTFQERAGDCFDAVRGNIRAGRGMLRKSGPDFLAYVLLDAVIDHYFPVLEKYGEALEDLEDKIVQKPQRHLISQIHEVKRDMLVMRRAIWPLREVLQLTYREDYAMVAADTRLHLRDCYDHTIQIIDLLETYREISSAMLDIYLSSVSNRTNEIMQVLTMMATVFMPLSFIASVYGMNFDTSLPGNMPELRMPYGYLIALGLMVMVGVAQLYFFRRKGWIGSLRPSPQPVQPEHSQSKENEGS